MIEAMKKIGMAAAVAMIVAAAPAVSMAEEAAAPADSAPLSASLDLPILSAYVWRGQVLNDEGVVQPSLTVSKGGFSLNYWQNFALTDQTTGDSYEFTEHDISVSYGFDCPITKAHITLGIVNYDFPNQAIPAGDEHEGHISLVNDTREAFATFAWDCPANPTISVYYDLKEADGFYANVGVGHTIAVNDKIGVNLGANAGFADSDWNTYYFPAEQEQDDTFVDANFSASVPFQVCDSWTLTPAVQYTMLLDNDLEDSAEQVYLGKDQWVGSLKASYTF